MLIAFPTLAGREASNDYFIDFHFILNRFVQSEMTKYQLQASDKWGFDFVKESPIAHTYSQFKWESTVLSDIPKFYHHIAHSNQTPSSAAARIMNDRYQLFNECENICPLSQSISSPSLVIQNPPTAVNKRRISVFVASTVCSSSSSSNQRKITGKPSSRENKKAKKMLPLIASLWLITPKSDLKTINSHQILILVWRCSKRNKRQKPLSGFLSWKIDGNHSFLFFWARRDVYHCES